MGSKSNPYLNPRVRIRVRLRVRVRVRVRPAPQGKYLINLTWGASLTLTLILKKRNYIKNPKKSPKNLKKFQKIFQKFIAKKPKNY